MFYFWLLWCHWARNRLSQHPVFQHIIEFSQGACNTDVFISLLWIGKLKLRESTLSGLWTRIKAHEVLVSRLPERAMGNVFRPWMPPPANESGSDCAVFSVGLPPTQSLEHSLHPARQCQRSCWPRSAGLLVHCCNKQLGGEINDVIISSNEAWGLSLDFLYPYGGHNGEGRGCDFRSQGRGLSTLNCTAWGWSGFGFGSKLCDFEWVSSPLWAYSLSLYRQVETYSECSSPPEDDSQSSGLKDFTYNSKVLH